MSDDDLNDLALPGLPYALTAIEHQVAGAVRLMIQWGYKPETITDLIDHVVTHGWAMASDEAHP